MSHERYLNKLRGLSHEAHIERMNDLLGRIKSRLEHWSARGFYGHMKTDLYTKVVLTVIAACLLGLLLRDAPTVTTAHAQGAAQVHVIIDGVADRVWLPVANPIGDFTHG